jgi:4-amino-4-deoxy-L-arabinose transferase-like glycosyltransferase
MEKRNKRYLDALIIAGLLFISLLIRGTAISNVYMYVDESTYLWLTSLIFINEWTPPEEILRFSPPLFNYLLAILTILFGEKIEVLRILSVVFGSLTVCFMYLLGKALYDRKVGLLSAFFLCFSSYHCLYSSYHCLYSRIIYLEALTLFFAVAFSYFFWMGYFRSEKMRYIVMAGIILGLAIDTKYISLFLIMAIFIAVLWVKRSFRALIDKKIAIVLIVAFLFFLPVLISLYVTGVGAYPFLFHAIKRFELPISGIASGAIRNLPIWELIMRGIKDYLSMLTYGYQNIPFYHLFRVSALILIPITFLFHVPHVIRAKHAESFIMALILSIGIIIVGSARHKYYLLYILPFYFILLLYKYFFDLYRFTCRHHVFLICYYRSYVPMG